MDSSRIISMQVTASTPSVVQGPEQLKFSEDAELQPFKNLVAQL